MEFLAVLLFVLGLAAGAFAGRALARSESAALRVSEERIRGEYDAVSAQAAETSRQLDETAHALTEARAMLTAEKQRGAEMVAAERRAATEKLALVEQTQEQLKEQFKALSGDALRQSNAQFLELADTQLKAARQPITDSLTKVEQHLREIERSRAGAQESLKQQIEFVRMTGEELRRETAALVGALRKPQARGQWGELHLHRAVELAGMADRCDFQEQVSIVDGEGKTQRPDMVVRLAGGKSIVVDSKVTLAAYLEAHEATDEAVREERLTAHARHLRDHVNALAAKSYWTQFSPAPEFVVLFVPGEAFLAPALERDPALLEDAFSKRVHIASPTTLISVLRTVAYAWQQETLARDAQKVLDCGKELYKRIGTFGGHMDKVGKSLGSAVKAFNASVGSLERTVLPSARRISELQVTDSPLAEIRPVDEPIQVLSAAELLDAATPSRPQLVVPDPVLPLVADDEAAAG